MKSVMLLLAVLLMSQSSFAAYICRVKGTQDHVGFADREGGRTDIYYSGHGYFQITSKRGLVFKSERGGRDLILDLEKNTLTYDGEVKKLVSCRGAGE